MVSKAEKEEEVIVVRLIGGGGGGNHNLHSIVIRYRHRNSRNTEQSRYDELLNVITHPTACCSDIIICDS